MNTQIAIAVVVGILVGLLIPASGNYLTIVGYVFFRLMHMSIPILILGHIFHAVGSIN
ncbi:cation:dicarboxylate symporter family transporter, partial [Enterococcus faecalis]|uniref:cation:dicarboxylate symporter family transporter n=1 Tax=Enterococcus faecalis TaxID=1351 RepID=UPI003CC63883